MKRGVLLLLGLTLALTACASETHLPYRAWYLSFSGLPYMEVWVEEAQVVDVTGRRFHGYEVGVAGMSYHGNPAGWASSSGYGAGRPVLGAALPKQIYVRWQSLVEPQTYQATLAIPESVRKLMLTQGPPDPAFKYATPDEYYYNRVNLGLAPSGWIKVWVGGVLEKPISVMCVKAQVVPQGPSMGKTNGAYAYTFNQLDTRTQKYLKSHPIPYASWKCDTSPAPHAAK